MTRDETITEWWYVFCKMWNLFIFFVLGFGYLELFSGLPFIEMHVLGIFIDMLFG